MSERYSEITETPFAVLPGAPFTAAPMARSTCSAMKLLECLFMSARMLASGGESM